jgi:hypothetical protein
MEKHIEVSFHKAGGSIYHKISTAHLQVAAISTQTRQLQNHAYALNPE